MELDVVAAVCAAAGAGGWAAVQTIQVRRVAQELKQLRGEFTAFLERFAEVAPHIARGTPHADRSA
jgi:hypothetical protein